MPLTAAQLVTRACEAAHCTGFTVQAGQLLNLILSDLAETQDLELCRGVFNFNFITDNGAGSGMGPYPLPLDYLRHTRDGVFFTIDGVKYSLVNYDQSEFDLLVTTPGLANYPTVFYTDISPLNQNPPSNPNMYVWQPSSGTFPVTVRYYRNLPDIVTPETSTQVPWFPNQNYLFTELSGQLMKLTDDARAKEFLSDDPNGLGSANILRRFMQNQASDDEGKAKTVSLDRRRFGYRFSRLPNTKSVGW